MLKSKNQAETWAALVVLKQMGPAAKDAIPALEKLLESGDPKTRTRVYATLKAINGDNEH